LLPEALGKLIGQAVDVSIFEIEKEPIRRFADAVGDLNPLYWDEDYARRSRFGSIIAPPGFLSSLWFLGRSAKWARRERLSEALGPSVVMDALAQAGYRRILDTGIDYEFFEPVKAGDTVRSVCVVKDIMERGAKERKVAFLITETSYTNQDGTVVAKTRSTTVHQ
jgi:acyl dehydratase